MWGDDGGLKGRGIEGGGGGGDEHEYERGKGEAVFEGMKDKEKKGGWRCGWLYYERGQEWQRG